MTGDSSNKNRPHPPGRSTQQNRKLELQGDLSNVAHADRFSTVIVPGENNEPTPPPRSIPTARPTQAPLSQRLPAISRQTQREELHPDEPTPPPGSLSFPDEPTMPGFDTGRQQAIQPAHHRPHQPQPRPTGPQHPVQPPYPTGAMPAARPTPAPQANRVHPPRQTGAMPLPAFEPPTPTPPPGSAAHDAEHITRTGFNILAIQAPPKPVKTSRPVSWKDFKNPKSLKDVSFALSDDVEGEERLQYAAGGFLAGAVVGTILGFLNIFVQGWEIADGTGQLLGLAGLLGSIFAAVAALRPRRIDEILAEFGLGDS